MKRVKYESETTVYVIIFDVYAVVTIVLGKSNMSLSGSRCMTLLEWDDERENRITPEGINRITDNSMHDSV